MHENKRNRPPLLYPKINPPQNSRCLVQRTHLTEWMQSAEHAKFVSICAPAGFGKTTLMVQWISRLREQNQSAAWLTVDTKDNDPRRFLFNLLAALQENIPDFAPDTLEDDLFDGMHNPSEVSSYLWDRLSSFQGPMTIFIDDFCSIKSPQVIDFVREMLHYLSPGKRLIAAMRLNPDLGLGKLRAKNQSVEIGLEDLRLSLEETEQFIRQTQNLDFDQSDLESLHKLTEGWVTGLQLSTLSPTWQSQSLESNQSFKAFHLISDYLVEDVLANQSQDILSFLLQTSILNTLTGPLCDALTGRNDGYEMLEYLEKNNLFLISLDEEHNWFRYHSLFAKFLQNRLVRRGGRDKIVELHRAAYNWYAQEGEMLEAAQHAMMTGDVGMAAEYMERCALDLVMTGQSFTVFEWGKKLPQDVLDQHLKLQFAFVYALIYQQEFEEAIQVIDHIYQLLEQSGEDFRYTPHLKSAIAYTTLCLDRFGEFEQHIAEGLEQSARLKSGRGTGHLPMLLHGASVLALTSGRFEEALTNVWQASKFLNKKTQLQLLYNAYFEGCIYFSQGRLEETLKITHSALSKTEFSPNRFSVSASAVAVLEAQVLYEKNELSKAAGLLKKYRSVLANATFPDILIAGYRTMARIHLAQGNRTRALQYITELERRGVARDIPRVSASAWQEHIHFALHGGDLEHALQIYRDHENGPEWQSFEKCSMLGNETETPDVTRLRILIAQNKTTPELLKSELKKAQATMFARQKILLFSLIAKAHYIRGERKHALRLLKEALVLAQDEDFIRTFVDEGETLPQMVREIYRVAVAEESKGGATVSAEYLLRILNAMGDEAPPPTEAKIISDQPLVEPLTDREKTILEKLAIGHSSEEIAAQLYVSVHTVRYHLRNVYSKLGANSRIQAVAVARRLNLIK